MDDYRTSASHLLPFTGAQRVSEHVSAIVEQAAASTVSRGRMLPFAGWSDTSTDLPPLPGFEHSAARVQARTLTPSPAPIAPAASAQVPFSADHIVERATAVLMDEMTKPRVVPAWTDTSADSSNTWVEKAHDVIDQVAELWRSAHGGFSNAASTLAEGESDSAAPEFEAQQRVRPGEHAKVLLTLQNRENTAVTLRPFATDLLGSRGCRIPAASVSFTPAMASLNPGEDTDLTITVDVPQSTQPGCYSGLVVVVGTDYLRALITVVID